MEKGNSNRKYRKYDEPFKQEVLKMTKTRSVAEVARNMGTLIGVFSIFTIYQKDYLYDQYH